MQAPAKHTALAGTLALAAAVAVAATPALGQEAEPACGRTIQQIADGFIPLFYEQGRVREAYETYVAEDYKQHNPNATDGRDAAIGFLEPFYKRNPGHKMVAHRVLVEEPYIVVHLHGFSSPEDRGAAAVDILRVEDCWIVEHWDVTQPVPERSMNDNGMF